MPKDPKITLSLISNDVKIFSDELPGHNLHEHKPSDVIKTRTRQLSGRYKTISKKRPTNPNIG